VGKGTLTLSRPIDKSRHALPRPDGISSKEEHGRFSNRCYVLVGLPGSGKTAWVDAILNRWKNTAVPTIISTDNIADQAAMMIQHEQQMCDKALLDTRDWVAEEDQMLKFSAENLFNAALGVRRDIIIDRHNLTQDDRSEFLLKLPDHYQKIGIFFTCPMNLICERLQDRFNETGQPFSRAVLQNMKNRLERPSQFEFDRVTDIDHTCRYR
jgi:tRNA uridine 5-carbamoylmethylation protein Kti12